MSWMDSIQNSATEDMPELKHPRSKVFLREGPNLERLSASYNFEDLFPVDHGYAKYYKDANIRDEYSGGNDTLSRAKRASASKRNAINSKTTCSLSIQTDPLLWKHIKENVRRQFYFTL